MNNALLALMALAILASLNVTSRTLLIFMAVAILGSTVHSAQAARLALVIGNERYEHVESLKNAVSDARSMARELSLVKFDTTIRTDLKHRDMVKTLDAFLQRVQPGDEVVVFYSGHGVQLKSGNYLLPTDIEGASEHEVEATSLALDALLDQTHSAKARFVLVIIDACRDNPLKRGTRSVGEARGLRAPEPPSGHMVIYSAARGQQALDRLSANDPDPNGLFTRELLKRIRKQGVSITMLAREIRDAVERTAASVGHVQRPAIYDESRGDFFFSPLPYSTIEQVQPDRQVIQPPANSTIEQVLPQRQAIQRVDPIQSQGADRRSAGAYREDESIGWKVEERIVQKFGTNTHINAVSYNRIVLITGEAPDEATKAEVGRLAGDVVSVRGVVNEVVVGPASSAGSRAKDVSLTSRITGRFVEANKFAAHHVKVHTSASAAFLMGLLTRQEADNAASIAATTMGVRKVVRVFEYVSDAEAAKLDSRSREDAARR